MSSRRPVSLGKVAKPVSVRASTDCTAPVFSVTKHAGMVPSSEYFKKQVFSRDIEGYKLVQRGQFAYATIHLDEGSIGLLDTVDRAIVSPMYTVFETDSAQVYGPYLLRLLKSEWALSRYQTMGNGSVHRRRAIPFDTLEKLEIALPDVEEQKRIAAILDKADSLRRKRQQAISLADDFLRAVFLDMFGDPVTNPKRWPIGTIRDLVSSANYGTSEKADETEGRYPILRMNNLTYEGRLDLSSLKYVDLDEKVAGKYLARKGDLLFNRTNSKELVGKTAVYDRPEAMAIAGYLIRVRMNEKGNPHYVSAYLNSAHGKATLQAMCKSIVGMANINAQEMQNIQIMLPPVELQVCYANVVEKMRATEQTFSQSGEVCGKLITALSTSLLS